MIVSPECMWKMVSLEYELYSLLEGVMTNAGTMWSEYVDCDKAIATVRPIEEDWEECILAEIRGKAPVSETESEDDEDSPVLSVESVTSYHRVGQYINIKLYRNIKLVLNIIFSIIEKN